LNLSHFFKVFLENFFVFIEKLKKKKKGKFFENLFVKKIFDYVCGKYKEKIKKITLKKQNPL